MLILVKPPLGEYGGAVAVNESYSVALKRADLTVAMTEMLEYTVMVGFHSVQLSLSIYNHYQVIYFCHYAYTLYRKNL